MTTRSLRLRSFAKVNLGLEVLGSRRDGHHELRTVFQSIDLHDDVVLRTRARGIELRCDHPGVPRGAANLAVRAARELGRLTGTSRGVEISITKRIPVAGGLGGGSSNAAAVLAGLDRLWALGLGRAGLDPLARRLGADVPYFLLGGTALGLGRGDEVYPLGVQVRAHVVLVDPGIPVSTAAVFRRVGARLTPRENSHSIYSFVSRVLEGVPAFGGLTNELESAAFEEAPALTGKSRQIRAILLRERASFASLSGSGSAYFGLFEDPGSARRAEAALKAAGHATVRSRTLSLDQYRRLGSYREARRRGRGAGKERTSWRSRTSRSFR
jgi:4-diphosphocytidyl-2-C-methyl-D-erythritol kinase